MLRSFSAAGIILLLTVQAAHSQFKFPPNTRYVTSHGGGFDPAGLAGLGARGAPTTFLPLPTFMYKFMEMNPTNDGLMILEQQGMRYIDLQSGRSTVRPLNGYVYGMTVDEDAGMAWLEQYNLYRSATILGTNPQFLTTVVGTGARGPHGPVWNGSTGGYVSCSYGIPSNPFGVAEFFDRSGNRVNTVGGFGYITDYAWSPWTGDILIADRGGAILRVNQGGAVSTVAVVPSEVWSLKVRQQSATNTEEMLACQMGAGGRGPRHLFNVEASGTVTTFVTASITPREIVELYDRPLWATGAWRSGSVGGLTLHMGPGFAGDAYRIALSLGHAPGFNVGPVHVHLVPDNLFTLTANGDIRGLTSGFAGRLDANGRAIVAPSVTIPSGLRGLRVFAGGITFNAGGITGGTNCWGITLQ